MTPFVVAAACCFWACLALVVYTYPGYPLVVWGLSQLFGRRTEAGVARASPSAR